MEISNKYQEVKKSKEFQKGVRDFKEGKCGEHGNTKPIWVKKIVGALDYKKDYRDNSAYCFLEKIEKGICLGFCVIGNNLPTGCELLTDEEARQVDLYRRAVNIAPTPLQ